VNTQPPQCGESESASIHRYSWRQDLLGPDGSVLLEDVLFVQAVATLRDGRMAEFHAPVFEEHPEVIEHAFLICELKVQKFIKEAADSCG
jgi:hypothetical protein